ncbi:MAG TPA: sigma-70 family RNA polymerase sigma factor [Streptosporangiaceae bacterium]|nr:sigma-70 family RNA polymerase sigma factor [Streptosporangiaceae bacterium]
MSTELIDRARYGDETAFQELVGPYQRELQVHCYRILGSVADAEDALQETLVTAWRSLRQFEGRASVRTWMYRIATTRCLNILRSASRRPAMTLPQGVEPPEPSRLGEALWLEPYPDLLLEELPDASAGPEARYEAREAMSVAFVTALQLLPPRQRAALILRDVLDFPASEVAAMLDTTEQSVTSALKRARATLTRELPSGDTEPPPPPDSPAERELVARLVAAFEAADVDGIVALMTQDAWMRMPPVPLEYQGRELIGQFLATVAFRQGRRYRLVPTRANGQPAFAVYLRDPVNGVTRAFGLMVATLAGDRISVLTRFDNSAMTHFGLPRILTD